MSVLVANAVALRALSVFEVQTEAWKVFVGTTDEPILELLIYAAPNLSCLHAEKLRCGSMEARSVLRNEPPFGLLRARSVCVTFAWADPHGVPVHEVMASVAEHASLSALELRHASLDTPGLTAMVVDMALSRRFHSLHLHGCAFSPACVASLARLLRDGALTDLRVDEANEELVLLNAASAPLLCDALRANTTLTSLHLGSGMWHDAAISAVLLGALTAHASLRKLTCSSWFPEAHFGDASRDTIGAALGALVAANAPALQSLSLMNTRITDAGMGPLLNALPGNTHLTELDIRGNCRTQGYVRDVLLPAVRANADLRSLRMDYVWDSAREAMALVASRAPR
jgi:hypothetical protein